MTPTLHPDFREFLFSLKRHRVRFVVVGAYVLASLGRPRYSDDLDIFVAASRQNAEAIADMVSIGRPPLAIDITTGIDGVSFEEAWRGRNDIDVDGEQVPFLGKIEYVRTKRAADRPKDRADLALLEEAGLLDDVD